MCFVKSFNRQNGKDLYQAIVEKLVAMIPMQIDYYCDLHYEKLMHSFSRALQQRLERELPGDF